MPGARSGYIYGALIASIVEVGLQVCSAQVTYPIGAALDGARPEGPGSGPSGYHLWKAERYRRPPTHAGADLPSRVLHEARPGMMLCRTYRPT